MHAHQLFPCHASEFAALKDDELSRKILPHPIALVHQWTLQTQDVWIGLDLQRGGGFEDPGGPRVVHDTDQQSRHYNRNDDPATPVED